MTTVHPLTALPFVSDTTAPVRGLYGATARSVNEGRGLRTDLATLTGEGAPVVALYDLAVSSWPVEVAVWERHPWSDQIFFALDGGEALVAVASAGPDGEPDLGAVQAFRVGPDTPFLYPAGLWHAPLFAIGRPGRFLMSMRETGRGDDTEVRRIEPALTIVRG